MVEKTKSTLVKAAIGASCAVTGAYVYWGLRTPIPGEDQDITEGLTEELHEFTTGDSAVLRVKRYANRVGTPVLFCHGFNGNGFEFDLPREGYSMAVYLARLGFDVWVSSFRGCGRKPYLSEAGKWKHSMDHLAIYDAPALVDGIIKETGKKPFWIGHSMGGMVLYMYLQGVRFDGEFRVVSDPELLQERNEDKLAGGVTIASPPAFWWPDRHPFRIGTQSRIGRSLIESYLHLQRIRSRFMNRQRFGTAFNAALLHRPRLIQALSRSLVGMILYRRANTDTHTSTSLVKWAGDDVSVRMNVQLIDGVYNQNFRQYFPLGFTDEPYDYTDNIDKISVPMFFVTGDRDFANSEAIRRFGFEKVSSKRKNFVRLAGYGHTDLVMGRNVSTDVYPLLFKWMREIETSR